MFSYFVRIIIKESVMFDCCFHSTSLKLGCMFKVIRLLYLCQQSKSSWCIFARKTNFPERLSLQKRHQIMKDSFYFGLYLATEKIRSCEKVLNPVN